MTYRREVEKAIKSYLHPLGFKFRPKMYKYNRRYSNDIMQTIGFADETHGRPHYYFMRTFIGVSSISLNEILFELTDGIIDHRDYSIGPVYHCRLIYDNKPYSDYQYIYCEFIGDRPMEENIADLDRMYRADAQYLYDMYNTQKSIYTCSAHEEILPFNPIGSPCVFYYQPLGFFFDGQFDKAFDCIEQRIRIEKGGETCDESIECINAFMAMRKNLRKWISNGRQVKVDDEYIPSYGSQKKRMDETLIRRIFSHVSLLLRRRRWEGL